MGSRLCLHLIDGVYSIILLDENTEIVCTLPATWYGVRPLFTLKSGSNAGTLEGLLLK